VSHFNPPRYWAAPAIGGCLLLAYIELVLRLWSCKYRPRGLPIHFIRSCLIGSTLDLCCDQFTDVCPSHPMVGLQRIPAYLPVWQLPSPPVRWKVWCPGLSECYWVLLYLPKLIVPCLRGVCQNVVTDYIGLKELHFPQSVINDEVEIYVPVHSPITTHQKAS
jgi:hypothetical protein